MAAHHRVFGPEPARIDGGGGHGAAGRVVAAQGLLVLTGAVDCRKPVEQLAQAGREAFVGQVHVGEKGVATSDRDFFGVEQGAERGDLQVGRVAVPDAAEIGGLCGLLDDGDDIGMFGDGLGKGVAANRPEARCEGDLLGRGQFLVAEEYHQMLEEGALDEPKGLGIQRPGQVDAVDFSAETTGQRANVDRSHARDFMPMAPARPRPIKPFLYRRYYPPRILRAIIPPCRRICTGPGMAWPGRRKACRFSRPSIVCLV